MTDGILWGAVLLLLVANLLVAAYLLKRSTEERDPDEARAQAEAVIDAVLEGVMESRRDLAQAMAQSDARVTQGMANLSAFVSREQHRSGEAVQALTVEARNELKGMNERLGREFLSLQTMVNDRLVRLVETNAGAADALNKKLATELEAMRRQNDEKLEAMRATVQEKLDKTLNERLAQSFRVVDEKLGMVENGLGEMRKMAESVTRLQNVLSNVKTRGTFGETQLEVILSTMLGPSQYVAQAKLFADANVIVDFAVRLPGRSGDAPCWLPLDSKFPLEDWEALGEAEAAGDREGVAAARKSLERAIVRQAKSIQEKYVRPPVTTEFAVMFLPSEGLYAEVLRTPGLTERLQRDFRVTPAGPTVLSALLNSLLMGFMTLAMEKRSSEVWRLLSEVKSEFDAFSRQFQIVEKKFREAQNSLEVMSTRQQRMGRRMSEIDGLSEEPQPIDADPSNVGPTDVGAFPMNPVLPSTFDTSSEASPEAFAAAEVGSLAVESVSLADLGSKGEEPPKEP